MKGCLGLCEQKILHGMAKIQDMRSRSSTQQHSYEVPQIGKEPLRRQWFVQTSTWDSLSLSALESTKGKCSSRPFDLCSCTLASRVWLSFLACKHQLYQFETRHFRYTKNTFLHAHTQVQEAITRPFILCGSLDSRRMGPLS